MSIDSRHSLGRRLVPAVAMTAAAAGLVTLLDKPSGGAAGDVLGGGAIDGGATEGAGPLDTTPAIQPPVVSSTLPVIQAPVGDDDGAGEDDGVGEDDNGNAVVVPAQPAPSATPAPQTTQPQPASSGPCTGNTVDGPTVNTRWGPVQVEAVVSSAGQICDVSAIQYPDSHRRSRSINQNALPILHSQVLRAQGANIRGVSGATITSDAYARSLQAILDGNGG